MLFIYSLIFLSGCLSSYCYSHIPNYKILSLLIIFNLIVWPKNKYSISLISYLIGLSLASYSNYQITRERWLVSFLYNKPVQITGTVQSIDPHYVIKINNINNILNSNYSYLNLYNESTSINLKQNQKIAFKTKLQLRKLPINFITNSIFDGGQKRNFLKGVSIKDIEFVSNETSVRQILCDKFLYYSRQFANNGLILAFLFGEEGYLTQDQRQAFLNTGTGHLIAISGMHITLVFMLITKIFQTLWFERLYLFKINKNRWSLTIAWLITFFYSFLAGFSVPIQRALIATTVCCYTQLMCSRIHSINIFGLCLFFVLIYDPLSIISASFWLSYTATFWLLYMYTNEQGNQLNLEHTKIQEKFKKYLISHSEVCTKVFIALIPITIFYFNKLSLLYVIANIIAIPVIDLLTIPLLLFILFIVLVSCLMDSFILGKLIVSCLNLVNFILDNLMFCLNFLQKPTVTDWGGLNLFSQNYFYYSFFDLLLLTLVLGLILAPRGIPLKLPASILSLLIYFNIHTQFEKKPGVIIDVLDVGQGLSVLIKTKSHQLLYDTGPKLLNNYISDKVVTNSLLENNSQLDMLVISHWDLDHSANLDSIITNIRPKNIKLFYSSSINDNKKVTNKYNIKTDYCNNNLTWQWDGVTFTFIKTAETQDYLKNNSSCVLKVADKHTAILLTGDIEQKTEKYILENLKDFQADLLLVPHHGSKTSSSLEFIKQVNPKYALISVGQDNIYRLPNDAIIERYNRLGIKIYRTDVNGALRVHVANDKINIDTARVG